MLRVYATVQRSMFTEAEAGATKTVYSTGNFIDLLASAVGELWHCRYDPTSLDKNGSHHGTSGNLDNTAVSYQKIPLFACTITVNYWHYWH